MIGGMTITMEPALVVALALLVPLLLLHWRQLAGLRSPWRPTEEPHRELDHTAPVRGALGQRDRLRSEPRATPGKGAEKDRGRS